MKKILLVDGDEAARSRLTTELRAYEEFRVLSTDCAKTAAKLIRTQQIDFLITELRLPEINGLKLLAYLKKYSPATHGVAITDYFSSQLIEKLSNLGIHFYLEKPVKVESLIDFIFEKLGIQPPSSIHGVALASFLQLMNLEQKTCTLHLRTNGYQVENQVENRGIIHCLNGEIIGAQTGELTGAQAFHKIMEWKNPNIKVQEECQNTQRDIQQPLMHLLMESHQLIDESRSESRTENESGSRDSQPMATSHTQDKIKIRSKEVSRASEDFKELDNILTEAPGVSAYEIFNDDQVLTTESQPGSRFEALPAPMEYFSLGNILGNIVGNTLGGSLKYSKISQTDRSSILMGKYHQFFIRATLKPGTEANDIFLKNNNPLM